MSSHIYIGTSGWHYSDWRELFYPPEITGYNELKFYSEHFDTVENNSAFYRVASEETYKTWDRMTPDTFKFSMKLNRVVTHQHSLLMNAEAMDIVRHVMATTQVLEQKLGAILIQLPASFRVDHTRLETFLTFFTSEVRMHPHAFDIAIEFRNKHWFTDETYELLRRYNIALVAAQSSRYPHVREITADCVYIRLHGPEKLFASSYSDEQLQEWADYISQLGKGVKRVYVYFNNDFHGYALKNAQTLRALLKL